MRKETIPKVLAAVIIAIVLIAIYISAIHRYQRQKEIESKRDWYCFYNPQELDCVGDGR